MLSPLQLFVEILLENTDAIQLNFTHMGPNFVVFVAVAQNRINDTWECKD